MIDDKCRKHGCEYQWLAGCSAHPDNRYCPECEREARKSEDMSEIKPCPFCGGRVNAFPPTLNESHIGTDPDKVPGRFYSMLRCVRCTAGMDGPNGDHSCRKVIERWNRRDESALAKARAEANEWAIKDDQPLPEDEAIDAAHPVTTGDHDTWMEAMRLVGAKRSKYGLVGLDKMLPGETTLEYHVRVARAEERERIGRVLDTARGTVIVGLRTLTMQQLAERVRRGEAAESVLPMSPAAYDDLLATDTD